MDSTLACPLCCGETFASREELRSHLVEMFYSLHCPQCGVRLSSIHELVLHLDQDQCPPATAKETLQENPYSVKSERLKRKSEGNERQDIDNIDQAKDEQSNEVKFLSSEQDTLNVIDSENHILIVGGGAETLLETQSIITTQNDDGTISFSHVDPEMLDMPSMEDGETATAEGDKDGGEEEEDNGEGEELYSCNTCGVSFTSVMDHIRQFHSQQNVVVEVAEDTDNTYDETSTEADNKELVSFEDEQVISRTDSQQIIHVHDAIEKAGLLYTRRLVSIDKFWTDREGAVSLPNTQVVEILSCPKCGYKTTSLELLDKHECKALALTSYNCAQCPSVYTSPKSLYAHMKVHKAPQKKITKGATNAANTLLDAPITFKCDVCDTTFPSNKSLRLHRRMHDPVKSRTMEAPAMWVDAPDTSDTFHCEECDKWIHTGYKMIHEEYHRSINEQYHCDICNRKFLTDNCLQMHRSIHSTDKMNVKESSSDKVQPYACSHCDRQFARPHEKVKHERIHTGEKPHACEICGKAFRVSYCLTLHMRTHTGARPYGCPHCGKRFKAHSVYNHHLLTHSDVRAYKCPYCPKAFKTSVQLAGHKNSHTKPFTCTQCNRPFASLYAVRVHTETHRRQNNLKYSCDTCGASYARAFALKDHVKSAHSVVRAASTLIEETRDETETETILYP